MATLALTTVEIVEVRSLLGNEITTDNLTDAQITSGVISGEASMTTWSSLKRYATSLNVEALGATEKAIAVTLSRDDADDRYSSVFCEYSLERTTSALFSTCYRLPLCRKRHRNLYPSLSHKPR